MKISLIFAALLLAFGCAPATDHRTEHQRKGTYPVEGNFHEPVAAVIAERDERFDVSALMGSAFLRDKERGIFVTAEHVIDSDIGYKLFFNGKVYKAERVLDTGVTDIGFLSIVSEFDVEDFPEPYPIADSIDLGEDVFVRGIHIHPQLLWADKVIHRIMRDYYGLRYPREFVYDNLSANIVDKEALTRSDSVQGQEGDLAIIQKDYAIRTKNDHRISFGGLSGGPTVNARGEVVGVNVVERGDEGVYVLDDTGLKYQPRVTLELLPHDEIKRALRRLNIAVD